MLVIQTNVGGICMGKNESYGGFGAEGVFAASNSAKGFRSYYGDIFDGKRFERLYIIKGGPGTGKSSFMRSVARYAEEKGYSVERYMCSSDPESVDGAIIGGRVAMIDGTAPHTADTEVAGARDEIINLGEFWDSEALAKRYSEISELSERKRAAYEKGYKYLSACGELSRINKSLFYPYIKEEKLLSLVRRTVSSLPDDRDGRTLPALIESVGMRGRVRLDTYERSARCVYRVIDWYSTAYLFLRALIVEAQRKGIEQRVSYDPIDPEHPNGVFFVHSRIAFVAVPPTENEGGDCIRVNMKRFIDRDISGDIKKEYKYNLRLYDAILGSACEAFEDAGKVHFELEKIYSECMDFAAKERFTASFCEMLSGMLGKQNS